MGVLAAGSGGDSPVDAAVLAELREAVGHETFNELIERFSIDAARILKEMGGMLEAGDHHGVRQLAHRLSGLLGQFGCHEAADICRAIEVSPEPAAEAQAVRRAIGFGETAVEIVKRSSVA